MRMSRRDCVQGTLATLAAAGVASGATPRRAAPSSRKGFLLSETFIPSETHRLRLARQIGVNYAIFGAGSLLTKVTRDRYLEVLTNETNYLAAELNLSQARLNEMLSLVQIYSALGGGWQQ